MIILHIEGINHLQVGAIQSSTNDFDWQWTNDQFLSLASPLWSQDGPNFFDKRFDDFRCGKLTSEVSNLYEGIGPINRVTRFRLIDQDCSGNPSFYLCQGPVIN